MTTKIGLLVGAHFRPPAKAVLQALPSECPLRVVPEPENPYDAQAMAVFLQIADLEIAVGPGTPRRIALEDALPGAGWTWEALVANGDAIQLGYLAREGNKDLSKVQGLQAAPAFAEGDAVLKWGANGEALVQQEEPSA